MIKRTAASLAEIIFPKVCICCANAVGRKGQYICLFCRHKRFESVNEEDTLILPSQVDFLFSMWHFDKGGYLQMLLHKLKYDYLPGVGEELGRYAAYQFLKSSAYQSFYCSDVEKLLVPVPLHPRKFRKRGYNQARAISEGISRETGWKVIPAGKVSRVKNTTTQTGLNIDQRVQNVSKAFYVDEQLNQEQFHFVIVDDVFTTGATTFELASALLDRNKNGKASIITIARA